MSDLILSGIVVALSHAAAWLCSLRRRGGEPRAEGTVTTKVHFIVWVFMYAVISIHGYPQNLENTKNETCKTTLTSIACSSSTGHFLPDDCCEHVHVLYVIDSDMSFLSAGDFSSLENLSTMYIDNCTIGTSRDNMLSPLTKLLTLQIISSNVSDDVFSLLGNMRSLISLSLEGNRLTRLSKGALRNLPRLEALDLRHNAIAEVEPGALEEALPRLRALRLWGNPLCEGASSVGPEGGGGSLEKEERDGDFLRRACSEGGAQDEGESEVEGDALSAPEGQTEDRVGGSGKGPAEGEAAEAAASVSVRSSSLVGPAGGQRPAEEHGPLVVAATSLPRLIFIAFVVGLSLTAVLHYSLRSSRSATESGGTQRGVGTPEQPLLEVQLEAASAPPGAALLAGASPCSEPAPGGKRLGTTDPA